MIRRPPPHTCIDEARPRGFRYDDPEVGIEWPSGLELEASARDSSAPLLSELAQTLPFEFAATYWGPGSRRPQRAPRP